MSLQYQQVITTTTVQPLQRPPQRDWTTGIFDCCNEQYGAAATFLEAYCCPCIFLGFMANHVDGVPNMDWANFLLTFCCPVFLGCGVWQNRSNARSRFGVYGNSCEDMCCSCCCPACTMLQVHRECINSGFDFGTLCRAPVNTQLGGAPLVIGIAPPVSQQQRVQTEVVSIKPDGRQVKYVSIFDAIRDHDTEATRAFVNQCNTNQQREALLLQIDREGNTPLFVAALSRNNEDLVLHFLNSPGITNDTRFRLINTANRDGVTILHQVCFNGWARATQTLLSLGAPATVLNGKGSSPLHTAAAGGNVEVVRMLLPVCNAIVNLRNGSGKTAFDLAVEYNNVDVANLLSSGGYNTYSAAAVSSPSVDGKQQPPMPEPVVGMYVAPAPYTRQAHEI